MTRCPRCGERLTPAAKLLIRARKRAGLTQAEAARRLGMLPQNLNAYEAGTRSPRPDNLRAILEILENTESKNEGEPCKSRGVRAGRR